MPPDERTIDFLTFHQSTQGLDQQQIRLIASCATAVNYRAGESVHAAGSEVEGLVLIISGELEISVSVADGSDQPFQYIGPDDRLGFLAIHDTEPMPQTDDFIRIAS